VLRVLPQAVGPAHLLCIAGFGSDDLIDVNLIADFASELDPGNVYWFVSASDALNVKELKQLLPNIHFIESELSSDLASYLASSDKSTDALVLKRQVLELNDLVVSVTTGEATKALTFRAAELREFRRHLVIVPDMAGAAPTAEPAKRRQDFISFLSLSRQTPDWSGVKEGFVFERDAYKKLLAMTVERVAVMEGHIAG
jgi:hypothetical protein